MNIAAPFTRSPCSCWLCRFNRDAVTRGVHSRCEWLIKMVDVLADPRGEPMEKKINNSGSECIFMIPLLLLIMVDLVPGNPAKRPVFPFLATPNHAISPVKFSMTQEIPK